MARACKSTRGRQPPPSKPPTKRRRRGTRIGGNQPSSTQDSTEVIRVQRDNITEGGLPDSTHQRNTTRSTIPIQQADGIGEGSRNHYTLEGGLVHRRSRSILETVRRTPSTTPGRQPDFGPEPPGVGGVDISSLHPKTPATRTPHARHEEAVSSDAETEQSDGPIPPSQSQAGTGVGGEDISSMHPKSPATRTPHARQEGAVSSDAETEQSDGPISPSQSQAGTDFNLRLIHEAFPQRGGSVDRAGIENIRRLARSSQVPDSIPQELANSQNVTTTGFGHHVPFMNTPQMTSEPVDTVDLETTLSNQGHSSTWESLSEEPVEPPFGLRQFFRNRIIDRDVGLGLLDHTITCPAVEEDLGHLQAPNATSSRGSPEDSFVRGPSDTQDRRSRLAPNIGTVPRSENNDRAASHHPARVPSDGNTIPVLEQTHTVTPLTAGNLSQSLDLRNPPSNDGPSPISRQGATCNASPHSRVGRRAARDNGRGRARTRQCDGLAELRPTPLRVATPCLQENQTVQTRPVDQRATATPTNPVDPGTPMAGTAPTTTTFPSRTRRALSPGRLARVRNLDKVRKRLQRAARKRAAQLSATGGIGAVSVVTKAILDLCAGEPQGESHKDLVGALSKIVPTELPCYREIKSVTLLEIEAICKRLAAIFSNAQDVLPTWTRKTVGRLLKSRRTRTRRKVKRLMAARAAVRRGQPSPPVPPGVFLVEVDHFVQELLTEEFQNLSKRMTDRSNNMIKAKGCGNKAGAGGYERAKAHISKREGRPATLRELRKWKIATERQYDAGPSRTAATRRIAGVTTPCVDGEVQSSDASSSSASDSSSSSSDPYDSDGTCSSHSTLPPRGTAAACDGLENCNGNTDSDSSADDGTADVVGAGGSEGPNRLGLDVMPAHWHHPIRGAGAFFDRYVELYGMEPGDREVAVWEANGRPWLQRPT